MINNKLVLYEYCIFIEKNFNDFINKLLIKNNPTEKIMNRNLIDEDQKIEKLKANCTNIHK